MARSKPKRLGDLQLRILKLLWERGEASVSDVHEALDAKKPLAYTTVATMLRKMEDRGLVSHRAEGRRHDLIGQREPGEAQKKSGTRAKKKGHSSATGAIQPPPSALVRSTFGGGRARQQSENPEALRQLPRFGLACRGCEPECRNACRRNHAQDENQQGCLKAL